MTVGPRSLTRSARLAALLAAVPACRCLADIACDHALLAEAAVASGRCARAIAIDVAAGPLVAAAARLGAEGQVAVELRRGDGFALAPGEADCAVVAGIGGTLLAALLRRDRPATLGLQRLVLSPHGDEDEVRVALAATGWLPVRETLLREQRRFYVILEAVPADDAAPRTLTPTQATIGRLARDAEPALLRAFATWRCARLRRELAGLHAGAVPSPRIGPLQAALEAWTALIARLPPAS